jgi:hypothetical protein
MYIKQISVFIENRHGRLTEFTSLLGKNGIDLIALSIADTTNFGILRAIVSDNEKALSVIRAQGYTANLTEVLAVAVPDVPGGLSGVLALLRDNDISIEYLYSFVRRVGNDAIIIFRVDQPEKAGCVLKENGIKLLEQDEIA